MIASFGQGREVLYIYKTDIHIQKPALSIFPPLSSSSYPTHIHIAYGDLTPEVIDKLRSLC